MKKPEELLSWDFPDTTTVPNGYDLTEIPVVSDRNFRKLLSEYNNLVEVVNHLCEEHGVVFDE